MDWLVHYIMLLLVDLNSGVAPDQREESEWWAAKKWAYAILGRLFHRYGNPSQLPGALKKEYGSFASHFVDAFAPEILSTYLAQVGLYCLPRFPIPSLTHLS